MAEPYLQDLFGIKNPLDARAYGQNGIQGMFRPQTYSSLPRPLASIVKSKRNTLKDPYNNILILGNYLKRIRNAKQKQVWATNPDIQIVQSQGQPTNAWFDYSDGRVYVQDNAGHPGVIAHELGHSAQVDDKGEGLAANIRDLSLPLLMLGPLFLSAYRHRDKSDLDYVDAITLGGASLLGGLASWIAGTRQVQNQRQASQKALQYIKGAGTFSDRSIAQSETALKGALKTYKTDRLLKTITGVATPLLLSGAGMWYINNRKKQNEYV